MSTLDFQLDVLHPDRSPRPDGSVGTRGDVIKLLNRITFGFTSSEYAVARSLGWTRYLESQLNHLAIDDSVLDARLTSAEFPLLFLTPEELVAANTSDVRNQLIRARLVRAVQSRRQLFERVVDLWTDHFNIWLFSDSPIQTQKAWDDLNVIRAHALASFPEMLVASAHSPSMLEYLNNDTNTAANTNENYARELLELHTMGVTGGYTQQDVEEVARCFTGWTFHPTNSTTPSLRATFRFNPGTHDTGTKIVLGHVIAGASGPSGQQDGETVLKILAGHPSTARFIAGKLLRHFWGDNPPESLITSIAGVYSFTQGDIKAMLRAIFNPNLNPPLDVKFKRPFHMIASCIRATGAALGTPANMQNILTSAGQLPFNWSPPDGYPDTLVDWSGLLLPRWSFAAALANSEYGSTNAVDLTQFLLGVPTPHTAASIVARIDERLFGGRMPGEERNALSTYLLPNPPTTARIREAIGLALGSPAFQWC